MQGFADTLLCLKIQNFENANKIDDRQQIGGNKKLFLEM